MRVERASRHFLMACLAFNTSGWIQKTEFCNQMFVRIVTVHCDQNFYLILFHDYYFDQNLASSRHCLSFSRVWVLMWRKVKVTFCNWFFMKHDLDLWNIQLINVIGLRECGSVKGIFVGSNYRMRWTEVTPRLN